MQGIETIKKMNSSVNVTIEDKSHNDIIIKEQKDGAGLMHGWQFVKSEGYEETAKYTHGCLEFSRIKTPEQIRIRGYKNGQKLTEVIRKTNPLIIDAIDDMYYEDLNSHIDIINHYSKF